MKQEYKKNIRLNLLSRLEVTSASQANSGANIHINTEKSILLLNKLALTGVAFKNTSPM